MRQFPSCFPSNFESEILPREAKCERKHVYRIIKYGTINREAFISTYEEVLRGLRPRGKNFDEKDPSTYSTSCNLEITDAQYLLSVFMRHYPHPFIAEGETTIECGPCQLTSERKPDEHSHVDWWIYENSSPHVAFKEVPVHDSE